MATFFQNLQMSPIPQTTYFAASYSKPALELATLRYIYCGGGGYGNTSMS